MTELMILLTGRKPYPIPTAFARAHLIAKKDESCDSDDVLDRVCACCGGLFAVSEMHKRKDGEVGTRCLHCAEVQTARAARLRAEKRKGRK